MASWRRVAAVASAIGLFGTGMLLPAPVAQAASADVMGATVSWDDSKMFRPSGCSRYMFNYSNGTGIRLLILGFSLTDPYGNVVANNSQIGINPGITGNWNTQICRSQVSNGLGPYTLTVEIKDYAGSVRNASAPFSFVEPPAPLPSAPQEVNAAVANRAASISWTAPATNTTSVREYVVTDAGTGVEVCRVPASATSCSVSELADGPHAFVVSATSGGNGPVASGPSQTAIVGPPSSANPPQVKPVGNKLRFVVSTSGGTSAVTKRIVVKTGPGKAVCAVDVTAADLSKGFAACFTARPKVPTRFFATLETDMGVVLSSLTSPKK